MLKPHEDRDLQNNDKVYVENSDGTTDYFMLTYEQEIPDWILIPYTDSSYTQTKTNDEGKTIGESLSAYGYDVIKRVA